jgi:hypothetical protein
MRFNFCPEPHVLQGLALPHQGGGIPFNFNYLSSSPLGTEGDGGVRGLFQIFQSVPLVKGGEIWGIF